MQTALMQGIRSLPRTTLCPHILPVDSSRLVEDITRPQFCLDALEYENEELIQKADAAEALTVPSSTDSYTTANSPMINNVPATDLPMSNEKIESLTKEQDSLTKALQVGGLELFRVSDVCVCTHCQLHIDGGEEYRYTNISWVFTSFWVLVTLTDYLHSLISLVFLFFHPPLSVYFLTHVSNPTDTSPFPPSGFIALHPIP